MPEKKEYNPTIDLLRVIAILAVIFIHTTTKTLEISLYALQKLPWTFFLNQGLRFAVPLFFLISGFVLELNYRLHESYLVFFKKRISRIFVPYLFWSVIYYFFVYNNPPYEKTLFHALLLGNASYQLYFIPSLLIFYLLFPFIHQIYSFIAKKSLIVIIFLIQLALLFYDYYIHPLPFYEPIRIVLLNCFIFYLGIVLANNQEKMIAFLKSKKLVFLFGSIFFAFIIFFQGLIGFLTTHNRFVFYSQWRPSVLIYTILISGSLYYLLMRNKKYISFIKNLSKLSFFVFFIHIIVLNQTWNLIFRNFMQMTNGRIAEQIWYDPLFFLVVTIASFMLAFVAHKIPYLSKIVG